jgi:hypothetical protein
MSLTFSSAYGSPKQLERLVKLLHLACVELEPEYTERGLSFATTVHECLHSANFWEQENIRCEMSFPVVFSDVTDVSSIIFCCSTRPIRLLGRHCRCYELMEEDEETFI